MQRSLTDVLNKRNADEPEKPDRCFKENEIVDELFLRGIRHGPANERTQTKPQHKHRYNDGDRLNICSEGSKQHTLPNNLVNNG